MARRMAIVGWVRVSERRSTIAVMVVTVRHHISPEMREGALTRPRLVHSKSLGRNGRPGDAHLTRE